MMWRRAVVLLAFSASLASCVASQPRPEELPPGSQRIELNGFTIGTPNESGWLVWQKDAHAVQLGKYGDSADETYAIQAWVLGLPQFYSDEAFVGFIANGLKKDAEGPRFIELDSSVSIANTRHGACVGFTSIHEDLSAEKRTSNPEPMLLEFVGLTCRNPGRPSEAAHVIFSHRYYPGERDSSLSAKARSLFDSLEFRGSGQDA